ncbi:hypothetical protein A3K48_04080 [candidate division WOR-1 bacterium RIFOXYA12_FULL_52_29]|uniref:Outer membrane protein beta-barrel domain-containing protein n=1 Tax=candidate division WOR-1 bacterium RIFOXYC12_FULL_54_18 TaxID=1802584 RepID=A0A1F4T6K4_UNCSA|nr:MAG: hypothetical protein A3K44_04080 [candidate division WOR-1 bacterium RIFOXYA2_FULL_51_19]OGC17732.1 MAG: hypothetical protein A3K48_04080 [candidate division WOR-1 bacterium RIFOXYA12_FULL_52_29]OGC26589.1 MAG: hypothetical protein A3K32_04075 [candidate division WOR-1 bacterium RIFOXYB2_FULL_45_9]OGC28149.1 MAG: hypothetical protein A3K49_04080 [candidate division WOR-1 bacterium RIFOXYC12_FULL_54_18]OGC29565.1 MAG: hypothetical protein A2346_02255 [candidate division WOR-1 bacterium R
MKKTLVGLMVVGLSILFAGEIIAIEGTATIASKDFYSLAQRKTYRLGIRGCLLSPTDNVNVDKNSAFDFGLEFDAKLNENLDTGPRFGLILNKKLQIGSSVDATYTLVKFGYGARIYTMYWGEYGSSHGFFNLYVNAEVDYYTGNKVSETTALATNPSSFAGMGILGGAGIELAFGPNTSGYAEVGYQKTSIKDANSVELPLDGYVLAAGVRLAFF